MVIKIIGLILVFCTSVATGIYLGSKEGFRINDLSQIKKALVILKSEIDFMHSSLSEAFYNISKRVDKPVSNIFETMSMNLISKKGCDLQEIWGDSILEWSSKLYLSTEDRNALLAFGQTMGYLDKNLQLNGIAIAIQYLENEILVLNERKEKKQKMYNSLGFLGGLLLVIILI